ncbi:ribonuclease domain-containing protein [Chryseobacterium sp.]|uniref:ribonuclease domain-containing protein n=1 Tax=Chryseobacterium sp. TaxID=1871047 RepID=UPI0025C3912B|nr:ribonuclease domain-containing protein [Chryseobacterium sp.]
MNNKAKIISVFIVGTLVGILAFYLFNNYRIEKINNTEYTTDNKNKEYPSGLVSIDQLTDEKKVISYVKQHYRLPDYYVTKNKARQSGWNASKGNLCEVLPGKAIGGDRFSNREGNLPKGEKYFEADVNYHCGNRNADRIVFTQHGDVYLTKNHYKSFEKQ